MVTGGAGYIGSVIAARLLAAGHAVTVYDDLSRGHRAAVPAGAALAEGDVRDGARLTAALREDGCEAIVHMAALAEVAESVAEPQRYADVNLAGTAVLAGAARAAGVSPHRVLVDRRRLRRARPRADRQRTLRCAPTNPYGETKLAGGARCSARRPLPAAAASPSARSATSTRPAPTASAARTTTPRRTSCPWRCAPPATAPSSRVFGDDYPTPDGTCVRDYVHVLDLADAHIAALERLPGVAGAFNLGTGAGDSVLEVLRAVAEATARPRLAPRRPAPPRRPGRPRGVATPPRLGRSGWRPQRSLQRTVDDAWAWMQAHPQGYGTEARASQGAGAKTTGGARAPRAISRRVWARAARAAPRPGPPSAAPGRATHASCIRQPALRAQSSGQSTHRFREMGPSTASMTSRMRDLVGRARQREAAVRATLRDQRARRAPGSAGSWRGSSPACPVRDRSRCSDATWPYGRGRDTSSPGWRTRRRV